MASNKTKPVRYCTHFKLTYELNCDIYNCYIRARADPFIDMKRLFKILGWNSPKVNFFIKKQLRQQYTFAEKKEVVLQSNQDSINSEQPESHDGINAMKIIT